ncbi:uncharacterized protein J4E79_010691 [Alternaria viburni]|uniref:uncharacterized protein n=1 Tax=Alternaria viburni TaxID=566460 RepID=UPI0020C2267E|nr:uncharacterized protein J4E79_010691 [Alternaria viburni]KAI4646182.1 hypothetical protein J4E79_010691 [Alternaria viburni]
MIHPCSAQNLTCEFHFENQELEWLESELKSEASNRSTTDDVHLSTELPPTSTVVSDSPVVIDSSNASQDPIDLTRTRTESPFTEYDFGDMDAPTSPSQPSATDLEDPERMAEIVALASKLSGETPTKNKAKLPTTGKGKNKRARADEDEDEYEDENDDDDDDEPPPAYESPPKSKKVKTTVTPRTGNPKNSRVKKTLYYKMIRLLRAIACQANSVSVTNLRTNIEKLIKSCKGSITPIASANLQRIVKDQEGRVALLKTNYDAEVQLLQAKLRTAECDIEGLRAFSKLFIP